MPVAAAEGHPGLTGVAGHLHGLKVAGGVGHLAEVGSGREAKGQSESVGVEGLERRDWRLAGGAGGPVCQVEEVEAR